MREDRRKRAVVVGISQPAHGHGTGNVREEAHLPAQARGRIERIVARGFEQRTKSLTRSHTLNLDTMRLDIAT